MRLLKPLTLLVALSSFAATIQAAEPPNIVLVMTDDQGYGDLGCTGNPVIDTPKIDAMAGRSASMKTFYVSPVCAPTRASLMTGRYNYRTRVTDTYKGRAMMDPAEVTVAEVLQDNGYATGIFGKWHLGDCYPMRPMEQGFDESLIHRGGGLAQPSEPLENERRYTDAILFENGEQVQTKGYCTDVYFDAAFDFIKASKEAGKPFFAYIPTNAPHGPFHDVPTELYEKYKARDLTKVHIQRKDDVDKIARVFAMVENVDQNMGRLFTKLDELEITKNTIVIFMVDNGPNGPRYVGNMRGTKGEVHEGGIRSPFFVQWPARLEPGVSSDRIAAHIDIMPTLLEAAGADIPKDVELDGKSVLPLLEGKEVAWPDRSIVIQSHRGDHPEQYHHFMIRTQKWKLLRPSGFGRETAPPNIGFELYDMESDPREEDNLIEKEPKIVAKLKSQYDKWLKSVSSGRTDSYQPPRIVIGTDHETETALTWQDWRVSAAGGWGGQGRWLLRFEGDHSYDAEVILGKQVEDAQAELTVGDVKKMISVSGTTNRFTISDLAIPAGDADLVVTISTKEKKGMPPYQVILTRKDSVAKANGETYDLVVYGGTSAGVIAAVQAKKMGKSAIIVCPDKHLGGLSAGGLGWTDTGNKAVIGGLSREFYHRVWKHYNTPEAWKWQKREEYGNRGQGTAAIDGEQRTMWIFEPHVAEQVFEDFVRDYEIPVHRDQWLDREKGVAKDGARITAITMLNGKTYQGKMFIDATYEGDLMATAGVDYRVGRESTDTYGEKWNGVQTGVLHHRHHFGAVKEKISPYVVPGDPKSGVLPRINPDPPGEYGQGDKKLQAYCFRMCLTNDDRNRVPFPKPEGYDPKQYELLVRIFDAGWRETFHKFDPIPNHKTDTNNHGPMSTDNIGFNYDYPEASYERRQEIVREHETYQKGWLYFICNDPRVPKDVQDEMRTWGLAKDEFTDNGNWPHQIYVREARRMVGMYVMTENELMERRETPDSVGMGSYTLDSHNVQRYITPEGYVQNEGDIGVRPKRPYEIAYGSLVPKKGQAENLLVPVAVSSSHIAFGSIRMEPVFMILGQSAATAASMAIDAKITVQDVPYDKLRTKLLKDGQVLEMP